MQPKAKDDKPSTRRFQKWILKCQYCYMYREEGPGSVCPHCHLVSSYTFVVTDETASEANAGRRLDREIYHSLHHAHPQQVSLYHSKARVLSPEARALVLSMADYVGGGNFDEAVKRHSKKIAEKT